MTTQISSNLIQNPYRKNVIINGSMVHNQRGFTSFARASGDGFTYPADRFAVYHWSDTGGVTVERVYADGPPATSTDVFIDSCIKLDITATDLSLGTSEELVILYGVEGYDFANYLWDVVATLSFWVKSAKTGTYAVSFQNWDNAASYVHEYTIDTANTWEQKFVTIDFDTPLGTWQTTNLRGVRIAWAQANASGRQTTTTDQWISGLYRSTPSCVNLFDSTANDFYLTGVQLIPGTDRSTKFEQTPFAIEEQLCKRYYQRNPRLYGHAFDAGHQWLNWQFEVEMRAAPTLALLTTTPYSEHPPFTVAKSGTASTIVAAHINQTESCDMYISGFSGLTPYAPSVLTENQLEVRAEIT